MKIMQLAYSPPYYALREAPWFRSSQQPCFSLETTFPTPSTSFIIIKFEFFFQLCGFPAFWGAGLTQKWIKMDRDQFQLGNHLVSQQTFFSQLKLSGR